MITVNIRVTASDTNGVHQIPAPPNRAVKIIKHTVKDTILLDKDIPVAAKDSSTAIKYPPITTL